MKKLFALVLGLSVLVFALSACSANTHTDKQPTSEYEKVLFALESVEKAMGEPKLKASNGATVDMSNNQIIVPLAMRSNMSYNNSSSIGVVSLSDMQSISDTVNDAILAKCFQNDRTLEDAFDVNIVKYVITFLELLQNDWDENTVYSTSVSGTLQYDFDTFSAGGQAYPYVMNVLIKAGIDNDGTVKIKLGFDVSLTSTEYGFSRYAELKVSSAYDVKSNDFSLEMTDCSDYTDTPGTNGFISYEKTCITADNNTIQRYADYSAQTDRRIALDSTHVSWQDYYNEGTKFTDHAKVFDGNNVYQSHTNFSNNKASSIVYKDALMTLFVDQVGLHEEINDAAFFDSASTESSALKTAEQELSKAFNNASVYTLLENLDAINLQVENTETRPSSQNNNDISNTKTIRQIAVVDGNGNEFAGSVLVSRDVTIEDLLTGKAECMLLDTATTIKIKTTYTDNSADYADSLEAFEILVDQAVVTDYKRPIVPENVQGVLVELRNGNDGMSAILFVACNDNQE